MEEKRWYSAKVYFIYYYYDKDTILDIQNKNYLSVSYEEIVYLIKATSLDEALEKGEHKAYEYEKDYVSVESKNISIRYLETIDVYEMFAKRLTDGAELHSTSYDMAEDVFNEYMDNVYPI